MPSTPLFHLYVQSCCEEKNWDQILHLMKEELLQEFVTVQFDSIIKTSQIHTGWISSYWLMQNIILFTIQISIKVRMKLMWILIIHCTHYLQLKEIWLMLLFKVVLGMIQMAQDTYSWIIDMHVHNYLH